MEQFMKRALKRTRTEEEYYDFGEESIKRHKVESITYVFFCCCVFSLFYTHCKNITEKKNMCIVMSLSNLFFVINFF